MTVDVTGSGFANYGPQCAASACAATSGARYFSPKYVTSPNPSAPDWQSNGLALGVDWPNTSSNATVLITFTTPVCGPLTFTVYDVNSGTWGGFNPVWRDRVTFSGTNDVGGGITPSTISACGGNAIIGNRIDATIAGTGCTNGTHTITYNAPLIKTISITYTSMGIDATYGTDPDPEYIIISNLTATTCAVLPAQQEFNVACVGGLPTLSWQQPPADAPAEYLVYRSQGSYEVELAAVLPGTMVGKQEFIWEDPRSASAETRYQLVSVDVDGGSASSPWIAATCERNSELLLFPNPTEGILHYQLPHTADGGHLSLFDAAGREVASQTLPPQTNGTGMGEWDLGHLPSGVYALRFQSGKESFTSRVILQ
jgi:hypothetical protein